LSNLLPAESLTKAPKSSPGFELAAPNPILGKTIFLRLPVSAEWSYEVSAADLRSGRNLILADQMWVTRGEARFVAVHKSGPRFAVGIQVRPWKPKVGSEAPGGHAKAESLKPPDQRRWSRSVLGRMRLARHSQTRLVIRCHYTERQIELRWEDGGTADLERLLGDVQCH
jgi:hypothetical protein